MSGFKHKKWSEWLWDCWCVGSLIGIWPRFIEPSLLSVKRLSLSIDKLSTDLQGLKILQFSDLHWHANFSNFFIRRLLSKINALQPDIIVFTGDFLCRAHLEDSHRLKNLLNNLHAPFGCFAILGNHDYSQFITVNQNGDYDVEPISKETLIRKGFSRLFGPSIRLSARTTKAAKAVVPHPALISLLNETSFRLLHNETVQIGVNGSYLNVCGLGEYAAGKLDIDKAFTAYDASFPGIVLAHNPDSVPHLDQAPGDIILSGHTHGGQVNLPWMRHKFTRMENPKFKSGLKQRKNKWIYINRGIGSVINFRWFALPELSLITLQQKVDVDG